MGMFLEEMQAGFRPRVLHVHLGGAGAEISSSLGSWQEEDPVLDGIGRIGGSALSLALFVAPARRAQPLPSLVLSVGSAVRRKLPTAARISVAGISPLGGGYVESQVGGGLAAALAPLADALRLSGRCEGRGSACLVIDREGLLRLEDYPQLDALDLPDRCAFLREQFPLAAGLCIGAAGSARVPFASFANLADPPSFGGRGGLGARIGESGLLAILIEGDTREDGERETEWSAGLAQSPHLQARGQGGTFELQDAFAARGDLLNPGGGFADKLVSRQACPGCPTACRHVLMAGERKLAGRFSATHPLGEALGLATADDSLHLLATCNAVGVDAGECGAALGVLDSLRKRRGEQGLAGSLERLSAEVQGVLDGELFVGAVALACSVEPAEPLPSVRGNAIRPVSDLAAMLGQCVSTRGSDPMRTFPFLSENGGEVDRLGRLVAPLELPPGTFDPKAATGKGRLVWWHENLANVVDASGFCAFSAAGLLGDAFGDLDDLARWLDLPGLEATGEALQAAGASLVLLQRELAQRLGVAPGQDRPAWYRQTLERSGMWDEYAQLRGLNDEGRVQDWARESVGTLDLLSLGRKRLAALPALQERAPDESAAPRRKGLIHVSGGGPLAIRLAPGATVERVLPCTLAELMESLATREPELAPWLWRDGRSATSVYRSATRLELSELVHDGDQLTLVVAISGG
ncbi:MAG: aldehyde:ferredoxin oxidoreductase [Candidatus Paceibacteria bacterium]|jgi:aldehyde:ferredoxin oxidoreductase